MKKTALVWVLGTMVGGAVLLAQAPQPKGGPATGQATSAAEPSATEPEYFIPSKTPQEVLDSPEARARLEEFLRDFYREYKLPKSQERLLVRNADGTVRLIFGGDTMEIAREDAENYYLRHLSVEDERSSGHKLFNALIAQLLAEYAWTEYLKDKYFFKPEEAVPPPFVDILEFRDASRGLPAGALWQMNVEVGDFDGDGKPDIVLPPPRKGDGKPHIFVQRAGGWEEWPTRWPAGADLDYGGVAVADFDGDGHLDVALACHFKRSYVFYGDGRGNFQRFDVLPQFPTTSRAAAVGDFDGDGRPDLALLAELDINLETTAPLHSFLLVACLNRPDRQPRWECVDATGGAKDFFGDQLAVQDIDRDGRDDVVIGTGKVGMTLMFLNRDGGTRWQPVISNAFPYAPLVPAVAALPRSDGGVVMGVWQRESPVPGAPKRDAQGLVVLRATPQLASDPKSSQAFKVQELHVFERLWDSYTAIGVGDVDGDGVADVVAGRETGVLEVFLRRGAEWWHERPAFTVVESSSAGRIFSLKVVDLNGDGLGDIVGIAKQGDDTMRVFALATSPRPSPGA